MSVVVASPGQNLEFRAPLEADGFATVTAEVNDSAFDRWIAAEKFDVVVFDRFFTEEQFGARVRAALPRALRVVDTVDLHFLRRERGEAAAKKVESPKVALKGAEKLETDTLRELAAIQRSDLTILTSPFEESLLAERYGIDPARLSTWGFSYPETLADLARPKFSDRRGVAFIGNFRHLPNADAVNYLARELWPSLRTLRPDLELFIYGAYPPKSAMDLHRPERGFHVVGPCDDAIETLALHRALLAPIRYGAGIKGKISDAWAAGTPVVTSPIGAEGMAGEDGTFAGAIVPGDADPAAWSSALAALLDSESVFSAAAALGRQALRTQYGERAQSERIVARIRTAMVGLDERRAGAWMQKILWREESRSTEYFSRWIELKNGLKSERTPDLENL